ncbi:MAG: nitroreductase family protein [Arcobacteraceae bacterium]|nr:nitroreductase family protein [Arcobacteraceae bacterium]
MDTIDTIKQRRSTRIFNNKNISDNDIRTMLECAMSAPTARNQQGWRFVVIDDKQILEEISNGLEHGKMCKEANKAIAVCYKVDDELSQLYWQQDASAATQNILLSATSLGIGSVWISIHPRKEKVDFLSNLLNLTNNIKPLCIVALGYKENILKEINRYDDDKVKYNLW